MLVKMIVEYLARMKCYRIFLKQTLILFLLIIGINYVGLVIDDIIDKWSICVDDNIIFKIDSNRIKLSDLNNYNYELSNKAKILEKEIDKELFTESINYSSNVFIMGNKTIKTNIYYSNYVDIAYSIFNESKININTDNKGLYVSQRFYDKYLNDDVVRLYISSLDNSFEFNIAGIYQDDNNDTYNRVFATIDVFEQLKDYYDEIYVYDYYIFNEKITIIDFNKINPFEGLICRAKTVDENKSTFDLFYELISIYITVASIILLICNLYIIFDVNEKNIKIDKINIIYYKSKSKIILDSVIDLICAFIIIIFISLLIYLFASLIIYLANDLLIFDIKKSIPYILFYIIISLIFYVVNKMILFKNIKID